MAQLLFFADDEALNELDLEASPSEAFVCMLGQGVHAEARAQLYSLIVGCFREDAMELEQPVLSQCTDGRWVTRLEDGLVMQIAELEEDALTTLLEDWLGCEEIESLPLDRDELLEFLFSLAALSQNAVDEQAGVFTFSTY